MKRSEMKKAITESLWGKVRQEDFAEEILSVVEELGMLPPDNGDHRLLPDGQYSFPYEWEVEDET